MASGWFRAAILLQCRSMPLSRSRMYISPLSIHTGAFVLGCSRYVAESPAPQKKTSRGINQMRELAPME